MPEEIVFILKDNFFVICIMAILIFGVTNLVKIPIKRLTGSCEEVVRKRINIVLILLPYIFGVIANYTYCFLFSIDTPSIIMGVTYGSASTLIYNIVERFLGKKIDNPYRDTEIGVALKECADAIVKNGTIDKTVSEIKKADTVDEKVKTAKKEVNPKDVSAVDRFLETLKK